VNGLDRRERRRRYQRQQQLKEYGIAAGIMLGILLFLGGVSFLGVKLFGILTASDTGSSKGKTQTKVESISEAAKETEAEGIARGISVMIDPGHGQRVPGCVVDDIMEKDITLAVSLKLRDELKKNGAKVLMTRKDDSHYPRLKKRGMMANRAKVDYFISVHCNSYTEDTSIHGFESYYYDDESVAFSDALVAAVKADGIVALESKYGNFQVLRDTKMQAVLLEIGYMSNKAELRNMCAEDYQAQLAKAIAKGFCNYITKK
jgi:N-acetylmuramoyl-L-alanine amidase